MIALLLIGGALLVLIFLAVGLQTCTYHPEFAGTPQYQQCEFGLSVNWPFLLLALVLLAVGFYFLKRQRAQRSASSRPVSRAGGFG